MSARIDLFREVEAGHAGCGKTAPLPDSELRRSKSRKPFNNSGSLLIKSMVSGTLPRNKKMNV
jgi:hypothetical protein